MPRPAAWREGGVRQGEIEFVGKPAALGGAHHSMGAAPGETGDRRRRKAARAAAIHAGAWSIPSVPAREEEREAGIPTRGRPSATRVPGPAVRHRPRSVGAGFAGRRSGTGRALSGIVTRWRGHPPHHRRDGSPPGPCSRRCGGVRMAGMPVEPTHGFRREMGHHPYREGIEGSGPGKRRRRRASHLPAPGRP